VSRLHLASVQEERLRLLCSPTDRHKLHEWVAPPLDGIVP
jgi:hypothetical protein